MTSYEYLKAIKRFKIKEFGFDTHARVLGITTDEAKRLWNEATNFQFKRAPRTEYTMLARPELSSWWTPYWELKLPEGQDHLKFYLTPAAPIIIPNGFITDKGSIPRPFRNIVAHDDREMMFAYLVHDAGCETEDMTRFNTDGLLYEVGTELGASWVKRNIIYSAVRAAAWHKVPDRIVNGINISKFNRELIAAEQVRYLSSYDHTQHLNFLTEMGISHGKI